MSIEPSAFGTRPEREPTLERSMGLLTMYPTTSVMISDQKASLGGSCPSGKCRTYSRWPESRRPALSTVVVQYAASCTTLTAGSTLAQEDAIAGLAAFEGGAPTVDGRCHGFHHRVHNDLCREKRQHAADDDSLHDVRD